MDYLRQVNAIIWKDVVVELRTRERVAAMGGFTVLVGILFSYAIDPTVVEPQAIAAGLIWMTIIFGGMLGLGRTFSLEEEEGAFQGILLSPIPRDAIFLAKVAANFIILTVVTALVFAVFALFFGLTFGGHPVALAGVVLLGIHRHPLQRHFHQDEHGGHPPPHPGLSPADPGHHIRGHRHRDPL
jgi:heme exporter protein B